MTLFTRLRLGPLTLPNRIVMGSMHTGLEHQPGGWARLGRFYAERAGAGMIITGGFAPNAEGRFDAHTRGLESDDDIAGHRLVTAAVHRAGGRIVLQILHTGRYGQHAAIVAPSPLRAPINRVTPREMSADDILRTIDDYAACARRAAAAGYDGVEVMGSEGYLLNQFMAPRTNRRGDAWGGSPANRMRLFVEVVRRVREALPAHMALIARVSALDLVEDGSPFAEVAALAEALAGAGADALNTGIGWHEARVPTIAHMVPRGAWGWATKRLRDVATLPVIATNRYNTPEVAEQALAEGAADLVSMARPFLADPKLPDKAKAGRAAEINTCIGCNQACLDFLFSGKTPTCLVNPRAAREETFVPAPVPRPKRIAVVGGGPAGLACAVEAAVRGHAVTLFEAADEIGGQFRLARRIPGKADYAETIRYFATRLAGVEQRLGRRADADMLAAFDEVVLATGVTPRRPEIPGIERAVSYVDVLSGRVAAGERVAIIGAGGIGFDTALFLLGDEAAFDIAWGISHDPAVPGGLAAPRPAPPRRRITLLQRKPGKPGGGLGKTTGWVHRLVLERAGVEMIGGADYRAIDVAGLHLADRLIKADTVVICAGQEPLRDLQALLEARGIPVHLIGGADVAADLDARRAIEQGTRLGLEL